MKFAIAALAALLITTAAHAFSITVDQSEYWLAPGTTFVDISGTVDNTNGLYPITMAAAVEHASNLSWDGHWHVGDPAFFNGHTPLAPGESYTGPLFEIGNMRSGSDAPVFVTLTPFAVIQTPNGLDSFNGESMFTIHTSMLHSVPEPATLATIGCGLVGLLARRRK